MGNRPPKPKRRQFCSWEDYQHAVDVWNAIYGNQSGSGWSNQSHDDDASVQVSGGYNRRTHGNFNPSDQRTDFEIFDKTGSGDVEKTHLSVDSEGNRTVWHGNDSFGR